MSGHSAENIIRKAFEEFHKQHVGSIPHKDLSLADMEFLRDSSQAVLTGQYNEESGRLAVFIKDWFSVFKDVDSQSLERWIEHLGYQLLDAAPLPSASTQSQLADLSDGASSNLPPWMEDRFPLGPSLAEMAKSIDISHSTDVEMGESSQYVSAAEEVDQTTAVLSSTSSLQQNSHDVEESPTSPFNRNDSGRSSVASATDFMDAGSSLGSLSKSAEPYRSLPDLRSELRNMKSFFMSFMKQEQRRSGRMASNVGILMEEMVRSKIGKDREFGKEFAQQLHITSLWEAVRAIGALRGHGSDDSGIHAACQRIADGLRASDAQQNLLLWYQNQLIQGKPPTDRLVIAVHNNPWVNANGLNLGNVRKCVDSVPKASKQTLAFLSEVIDWGDVELFSSPRGHGLYLAMFQCFQQARVSPKLMSFPPSGELELDCRGRIKEEEGVVTIEIGEIKSSLQCVSYACDQLERSITFLAWLHHQLDPSMVAKQYRGIGYVFLMKKHRKNSRPDEPETRNNIEFRVVHVC